MNGWKQASVVAMGCTLAMASVASAGVISGSFGLNPDNPTVISDFGDLDWAVWGANSDNSLTPNAQKDAGGDVAVGLIPSLSQVGSFTSTPMSQWDIGNLVDLSWSGGITPNTSATASQNPSLNARGVDAGNGLSISLAADATMRRAYIFVTAYNRVGDFSASLSDASATAYTNSWSILEGEDSAIYVIDYQADSAGQTLDITWIAQQSNNPYSNVGIQGIAISSVVPEPASLTLLGLGGLCLLTRRRA